MRGKVEGASWLSDLPIPVVVAGFAGLMLLVLLVLMRSSSKGFRKLRIGRVSLIVGRKGHGKTLYSVHEALRHAKSPYRCPECSVVHPPVVASNGQLTLPGAAAFIPVHGWGDVVREKPDTPGDFEFCLPHGTLLVIDEAQNDWAPAIASATLPAHARWFLSQCRKGHVEVIAITQHESRVAAGLRAQCDEVGVCKRGYFRQMKVRFCEPENLPALRAGKEKPLWTFSYRVHKSLTAAYDTYALLPPAREVEGSEGRRRPVRSVS